MLDAADVEGIYQSERDRLVKYSRYKFNRGPEDAEDATQEVFARFLEHGDSFSFDGVAYTPRAVLFRMSHNYNVDQVRKLRHWRSVPLDTLMPTNEPIIPADVESRIDLRQSLAVLPEQERTVLSLRFLEGLGIRQISETTGKSLNSVKQVEKRALKRMKKLLENGFYTHYNRRIIASSQ